MIFGYLDDGTEVCVHEIENGPFKAGLCDLGAGIAYLKSPDRLGRVENVVLRYRTPQELLQSTAYFGLTVGRFANRIAGGRFAIDGNEVRLGCNNGANHLHGGASGLSFNVWKAQRLSIDGAPGVRFSISDPDGHENYPGDLEACVTYILKRDGSLVMNYRVTCSKPCPVSFTNHAYFNLDGEDSGHDVMNTVLQISCARYLPVDSGLIPTGEIAAVTGTPFDFTTPKRIGRDFAKTDGGYDHCFALDDDGLSGELRHVATALSPESGRMLKVFSTMPAVQLYTGNFLHDEQFYPDHAGFCLETEFYPDSPNHPEFPDCILRPNEVYRHTTVYHLGIAAADMSESDGMESDVPESDVPESCMTESNMAEYHMAESDSEADEGADRGK